MKISDILRQKRPVSFEIFPPKGELSTESFRETLDALSALHPDFISVTCLPVLSNRSTVSRRARI